MSDSTLRDLYGHAALHPDGDVVAASHGTWQLSYVVGTKGVERGGRIRIYTDSDTDWGVPQFDDPTGEDYMTVIVPHGARVAVVAKGDRTLLLVVTGRAMKPGERIALTFGDRSAGGPGSRAQSFLEEKRYFWVAVDAAGDGTFITLPDPPHLSIVGGPAARLIATAPSAVVAGQPFRLLIRAEDQWGNPATAYGGRVTIQAPHVEIPTALYAFSQENGGVCTIEGCVCSFAGVHRIAVRDAQAKLSAESNPILCVERAGEYSLYWGDPHGGQVVMAEKIPDFFRYGRDVAGVDFVGYQANAHRVSNRDWAIQQRAEREFYEPGRFVPLPGFEWTGTAEHGGHHNVYFRRHDQPIRRSCHLANIADQTDQDTDLPHIRDVYQAYRHADVVITPHVGGGRADLTHHEPNLEPLIEVTSTHGTFEWFLEDALRRKYKLGFIGGSDGYTGRPGAEYPRRRDRRFAKGGLAALYATELTLEGVFEALKARRAYGTTGARILVRIDGDGHMMGQEYRASSPPTISAFVAGTAPLESVELFRGLESIYRHPLDVPPAANRVRILWEGASRRTSYAGVVWDGSLKVTGGAISLQERLRFDSPRSRVFDLGKDGLRWHSVTCGYRSGIVVDVQGDSDPEFHLAISSWLISRALYGGFGEVGPGRISRAPAERASLSFNMKELASGPKELEIGPLNRKLTVCLAPEPGTAQVAEYAFTDPSPNPGINPYWLRVTQTDMEMAWSSPIYVDYVTTD